jgi:PPOX class probable F420-dependent enzyme
MTLSATQRAYLDETLYAVIGTLNADGTIQQTLVWYMLDDDVIRFSVRANSTKVRNLRRNPTVSVTVTDNRRYLTLQGLAEVELPDTQLRERLATRYLGPEKAAAWLERSPDAPRLSVRVTIQKVYGQGVS